MSTHARLHKRAREWAKIRNDDLSICGSDCPGCAFDPVQDLQVEAALVEVLGTRDEIVLGLLVLAEAYEIGALP